MDAQHDPWVFGLVGLIVGAGLFFAAQSVRGGGLGAENVELKKKLESSEKTKKNIEAKLAEVKKQIELREEKHKATKNKLEKDIFTSRVEKETALAEAELHISVSKKLENENKVFSTRIAALEKDMIGTRAELEEERSTREKQAKGTVDEELKKLKSHFDPLVKQLREELSQYERREKIRKEASTKQIQEYSEEIKTLKNNLGNIQVLYDEAKKTNEKNSAKATEDLAKARKDESNARLEVKTQIASLHAIRKEYQAYKESSVLKSEALKREYGLIERKMKEYSAKLASYDPESEKALQAKVQALTRELCELKSSHQSSLERERSEREALLSDIKVKEQDLAESSHKLLQKCLELEKVENCQIATNTLLLKITGLLHEKRERKFLQREDSELSGSSNANLPISLLGNGHSHQTATVNGTATQHTSFPVKCANGSYVLGEDQHVINAASLASGVEKVYRGIVLETNTNSKSTIEMYRDIVSKMCGHVWQN